MLKKPKKPGSHAGREWTPAQQQAFRIFNLRGLWNLAGRLSAARALAVQEIIDDEICALGGESEFVRAARRREEFERSLTDDEMFEEVPF